MSTTQSLSVVFASLMVSEFRDLYNATKKLNRRPHMLLREFQAKLSFDIDSANKSRERREVRYRRACAKCRGLSNMIDVSLRDTATKMSQSSERERVLQELCHPEIFFNEVFVDCAREIWKHPKYLYHVGNDDQRAESLATLQMIFRDVVRDRVDTSVHGALTRARIAIEQERTDYEEREDSSYQDVSVDHDNVVKSDNDNDDIISCEENDDSGDGSGSSGSGDDSSEESFSSDSDTGSDEGDGDSKRDTGLDDEETVRENVKKVESEDEDEAKESKYEDADTEVASDVATRSSEVEIEDIPKSEHSEDESLAESDVSIDDIDHDSKSTVGEVAETELVYPDSYEKIRPMREISEPLEDILFPDEESHYPQTYRVIDIGVTRTSQPKKYVRVHKTETT